MKYYTEQEIEILKREYGTLDRPSLLELLNGHTWTSILWKAQGLGLERPNIRTSKLKFLLENSIENAYWWGFIMSDGHINKKGGLAISLHKKDREHLEKLAKKGKTVIAHYPSQGNMISLTLMDKINAFKLKDKLRMKDRKTYNAPESFDFLQTPEEALAFFIGFIDGDGNLTFNKKGIFKSVRVIVHGNWFEFFRKFCLMLEKNFLNFKFNVNNTNKRGNTTVYFGKKSNYLFLTDFIKKHNLPALNRKWKIQYAT